MSKCQFTVKYIDLETLKQVDFNCEEEPLASDWCIFHDKDYLQDKTNNEEHKRNVLDRLKHKVNHAISKNETLLCIGFQLPDFSLSDLSISKEFTKTVYFNGSQFFGYVNFSEAIFEGGADFSGAIFIERAHFFQANFRGRANFIVAKFQGEADFVGAKFQENAGITI